jgi:hypothetical protein
MLETFIQLAIDPPAVIRQYIVEQLDSEPSDQQPGVGEFLFDPVGTVRNTFQSPEFVQRMRKGSDRTLAFAQIVATPQIDRAAVPAPDGWRSVATVAGVTVYNAPSEDEIAVEPVVAQRNDSERGLGWDGTRHPYVIEVSVAELLSQAHSLRYPQGVAPQQFIWNETWQGEGYSRERDRQGQLISQREEGADIHIGISFDQSITNPEQPNLRIILINDQDVTAQVTNLSAFLMDQLTGETIDRRDFEQLPPTYEVTLSLNGGFKGTEVRTLDPLGTLVFEYHVTPQDLPGMFPIKLQGINRLFAQRQQEVEALESQGWVVMEVPPPS